MHVFIGTANRFCTFEGVWEAVNIDNCTREVFLSLNDRVRLCSYCIIVYTNTCAVMYHILNNIARVYSQNLIICTCLYHQDQIFERIA